MKGISEALNILVSHVLALLLWVTYLLTVLRLLYISPYPYPSPSLTPSAQPSLPSSYIIIHSHLRHGCLGYSLGVIPPHYIEFYHCPDDLVLYVHIMKYVLNTAMP